ITQINVAIAGGNPDVCVAPVPNAGTYTACGTVNGKSAYCKGANLRIVWTGTRWELQGDDPNISGVTWVEGWHNDAAT
ncbi:hypothetical protein NL533_36255, partial [Klebsiella pneumoniae]|nr:hypothetical protein [Klebsiella pneumoniae]